MSKVLPSAAGCIVAEQDAILIPGMRISGVEILVVCLLILLLFGAKRLPDLARSIGKAFKAFKREVREVKDDLELDERSERDEKDE